MCRLRLEFGEVRAHFGVDVTELGRRSVRNVCMIFDRHHRARMSGGAQVFSRTV